MINRIGFLQRRLFAAIINWIPATTEVVVAITGVRRPLIVVLSPYSSALSTDGVAALSTAVYDRTLPRAPFLAKDGRGAPSD